MPERDGYIPGVPCWVDATEPDPGAALEFYGTLFDWEFEDVAPAGSDGRYFIARREAMTSSIFDVSGEAHGGDVAAVRSTPEPAAPQTAYWNTYFWVDSADEAAAKVRDAGGSVLTEPFELLDACRTAVLADPEGAAFSVWEARGHKGARLVNDPGSLVLNGLNTRGVESVRSFYGSVFGWQTLDIGGGAEMWTLPGYGDYLERYHPELRRRMADAGAPPGFEDVVASINPIPDDAPDTPAHWSVTFAVADTDATAATATELGGRVIVPPFDAPWSTPTYTIRIAVIGDPQGATFTASRFVPKTDPDGESDPPAG
jgi:uncharacterized protein